MCCQTNVTIVTVVRDNDMYEKCIGQNPHCKGCDLVYCDNRTENKSIPFRYNRFLDEYDHSHPGWIVFCHEDFRFDESVVKLLSDKNPKFAYGPIGAAGTFFPFGYTMWHPVGLVTVCNKDGKCKRLVGRNCKSETVVDTLDCCCLIVHSSLFVSHALRFDERLPFDLYVEDFCVTLRKDSLIRSRPMAIPIKCTHFSDAFVNDRYRKALDTFNQKWKSVAYCAPCSWCIGGKRFSSKWISGWMNDNVILPTLRRLGLHS